MAFCVIESAAFVAITLTYQRSTKPSVIVEKIHRSALLLCLCNIKKSLENCRDRNNENGHRMPPSRGHFAPAEHVFDGVEGVDHMMHVTASVAGGESVLARHSGRRKSLFRECLRTRLNFTAAGAIIEATKTDLGDEEVKLIVKALEHLLRLHAGNAAR